MMVRKMQPDIIIRGRGIGAYGDYYTPEREVPGGPSHGVWKVIYPCGRAFSYRPNDVYKPAEWIVENLIQITAKGGNFEVGFGPMPNGEWPPGDRGTLEICRKLVACEWRGNLLHAAAPLFAREKTFVSPPAKTDATCTPLASVGRGKPLSLTRCAP